MRKDSGSPEIIGAVLTLCEPAFVDRYLGSGKWRLTITSMDKCFGSAEGYTFHHNDYYMGYDVYSKTVGTEVFTGIEFEVRHGRQRLKAAFPIPPRIRKQLTESAEKSGYPKLPRNLCRQRLTRSAGKISSAA